MAENQFTADSVAAEYRAVCAKDQREMDGAWKMYQRVVLAVLLKMLERAERDASYGFLDMKVDLISGEDFADRDEIRGRDTIYPWIQGRGLEALAGHARWLTELNNSQVDELTSVGRAMLVERIQRVTRRLVERMETLRAASGGRLSFMMRASGEALRVVDGRVVSKPSEGGLLGGARSNFSDLFYGKGLAAAAAMLGDERRMAVAKRILQRVENDVRAGRFVSDQEQLDARNPVTPVQARIGHGPRMILIGAAALMVELTGKREWARLGDVMMTAVIQRHVNLTRAGRVGDAFDMWEFVDQQGHQLLEEGKLRSDPGHATEFVGLSLKLLRVCHEKGLPEGLAPGTRGILEKVLRRNFENGFSQNSIGICKAFDLVSRQPMNTDMPWWNLPETMRAAMEAAACTQDQAERQNFLQIVRHCSNAFMKYFIRPDRWLMANQTVDENGHVAARIPATPDADPGYHTGLSLIDCLRLHEATNKNA